MAFNGSGTYSLPGAALNTGDTVSATENNTLRNDMATAFNKTLCRDGQATPTANLPMGGFKHTGLAAGTTAGDSVRYEQLPSGSNVLVEGSGGTGTTVGHNGFKNRIINGAMQTAQYGTSTSVSANSTGYSCDRFRCDAPVGQGITSAQVTASLSGFQNALQYTAGTGSTAAGDNSEILQFIEGYNVSDLQFGTANAQTITLSFWAKSSLTGTFGLILENGASNRQYVTTYSIPVANTWTYITKTIVGDSSGTWLYTNGRGIGIRWDMGVGTTNSIAATNAWGTSSGVGVTGTTKITQTTGATFTITGVQLEKGSTATSFDYRPYGTELALCQRYYVKMNDSTGVFSIYGNGVTNSSSTGQGFVCKLPVTMRAQPSSDFSTLRLYDGNSAATVTALSSQTVLSSPNVLGFDVTCSGTTLTSFRPAVIGNNNSTSGYLAASAEL